MWYENTNYPTKKKVDYKCPICGKEQVGKGYCYKCLTSRYEDIKIHEEKLEKRRKYTHGDNIKSIDEIFNYGLVYLNNKIMCSSFLLSMPCHTVHHMVHGNCIYRAVKKEE